MRVFAAVLLSIGMTVSPVFAANDAKGTANDVPAATSSETAPAVPAKAVATTESSAIENQLLDLRNMVETQTQELEEQRAMLKAEQLKMAALEEKLHATETTAPATEPVTERGTVPAAIEPGTVVLASASPAARPQEVPDSPLQLRIGSAYLTPVGFMDFTGVYRNHDGGSGIGTNFASIPYGNNVFQNRLSEFRESMQNSRVGFRFDAIVKGAHVIGYMESDFLGNNPGNVAVSSNSNTLRSRLYWVDVQKGKWELLGGQSWSLITPGRTGISPLPGNIFFSQDIDVNYQAGLAWGRIPELRFVYRPTDKIAFAVAADSPEQYVGGSSGGPTITLPASLNTSTTYAGEFNNGGGTTLTAPNIAPDFIAKLAVDPSSRIHVEGGGVVREFKAYNPNNLMTFTKTGGGGFLNFNVEVLKGLRILTNNFYGDGVGRYIFGQVPDLIARADGSLSPIRAGSTVTGFEFTHKNLLLYSYYGAIYVFKNTAIDTNVTPNVTVGYGVPGSTSQNRNIQEETFGFNQTIWKDGKYGALNLMGQYSYLSRNPWAVPVTTPGSPEDAHLSMVFLNLRYTLPGSAPAIK